MLHPSDETKLETLNDHYKDTFIWLQETRKLRDRLYVSVAALTTLLVFQLASAKNTGSAIGDVLAKQLGLQTPIDVSVLGSLVWFGLLGLTIRYFQTTVSLERQYRYIHLLEEELSKVFDGKTFTREGKFYLTQITTFSNFVWVLYVWASPVLLIVIVLAKIFNEWSGRPGLSFILLFNTIAAILILGVTVIYLNAVHAKQKEAT